MRFLLLLSRQSRGLGSDAETGTAILGWSRENLKFPIFYSLQLNKEANDETTFNQRVGGEAVGISKGPASQHWVWGVFDTFKQCCESEMIYSGSGSSLEFSEFRIRVEVRDPCGSGSNP